MRRSAPQINMSGGEKKLSSKTSKSSTEKKYVLNYRIWNAASPLAVFLITEYGTQQQCSAVFLIALFGIKKFNIK